MKNLITTLALLLTLTSCTKDEHPDINLVWEDVYESSYGDIYSIYAFNLYYTDNYYSLDMANHGYTIDNSVKKNIEETKFYSGKARVYGSFIYLFFRNSDDGMYPYRMITYNKGLNEYKSYPTTFSISEVDKIVVGGYVEVSRKNFFMVFNN